MKIGRKIQVLLSKIGYAIGLGLERNTPNLRRELEFRATKQSADYVEKKMSEAVLFLSHDELLQHSFARMRLNGCILEFGVYKGNTINKFAKLAKQSKKSTRLVGFDSFEGLPSDWAGYVITKETFNLSGNLPKVHDNVQLIPGFFDDTLPNFVKNNSKSLSNIGILHIDSDLYSSCKTILDELQEYITSGTFILFDEYFNFPTWQEHEFKAFKDFVKKNDIKYKYLGIYEQKVLVEIL
jgi:hypothetical protein